MITHIISQKKKSAKENRLITFSLNFSCSKLELVGEETVRPEEQALDISDQSLHMY